MANDKQYKLNCLYIATRGVSEYRASIDDVLRSQDKVLEIGCEWGTTSRLIQQVSANLIATDVSQVCIDRANQINPGIDFRVLDVFDIKNALSFEVDFNKMYIDVSGLSGYRSLLDVISLLEMYASVFPLEAIVVKSGSLKNFAKRCKAWRSQT